MSRFRWTAVGVAIFIGFAGGARAQDPSLDIRCDTARQAAQRLKEIDQQLGRAQQDLPAIRRYRNDALFLTIQETNAAMAKARADIQRLRGMARGAPPERAAELQLQIRQIGLFHDVMMDRLTRAALGDTAEQRKAFETKNALSREVRALEQKLTDLGNERAQINNQYPGVVDRARNCAQLVDARPAPPTTPPTTTTTTRMTTPGFAPPVPTTGDAPKGRVRIRNYRPTNEVDAKKFEQQFNADAPNRTARTQPPNLIGTWDVTDARGALHQGAGRIQRDTGGLDFTMMDFSIAADPAVGMTFLNPDQIKAVGGKDAGWNRVGTINADASEINWSDRSRWKRISNK